MGRRCTHCYQSGHNRRTCPDMSDYRREVENEDRKVSKVRTCSFCKHVSQRYDWQQIRKQYNASKHCKETLPEMDYTTWYNTVWEMRKGHNRRTCPIFKSVVESEYNRIRDANLQRLAKLRKDQVGIGTMVKTSAWNTKKRSYLPALCFIVGVDWGLEDKGHAPVFLLRALSPDAENSKMSWPLALRISRREDHVGVGNMPDTPHKWLGNENPYFKRLAKENVIEQTK
jgi:hypothetical protein